ncbi:MAG TPA: RNA polymerase subunit sigma-24 [Chitinophagaceae bacterium]|nr:RNA polymerase subunit sigma-24 [Chitinophagaceae bacterium]
MNLEFEIYAEQLKSYLYRLTANKEDAEDLLHDTFIKAHEKIETFKGNSSLKTWVFSIATNLAKDNQRVKNRWDLDVQDKCKNAAVENPKVAERIVLSFNSQSDLQFEIKEHINYCFTCIAKNLTLEKQIAIILKEIYDFKRTEIAEILNVTEGVVKHQLHDGRKELQLKYENRCALINKTGVCYQCAELNDYLQTEKNSTEKISKLGLSRDKTPDENLNIRFQIINQINPLNSNGADLEDTILQILRETINDK